MPTFRTRGKTLIPRISKENKQSPSLILENGDDSLSKSLHGICALNSKCILKECITNFQLGVKSNCAKYLRYSLKHAKYHMQRMVDWSTTQT